MKKYYLNIAIDPSDSPFEKVEKLFRKRIRDITDEFDQRLYAKEVDEGGPQLTLCYRGDFADLATFADNVIASLENTENEFPFRVTVFFGDQSIVGDNLVLYEDINETFK